MKYKIFIIISFLSFIACNPKEQRASQEEGKIVTKYNIVTTISHSPYLDLYLNNTEAILQYSFKEYPYNSSGPLRIKERNIGKNSIMLTEEVGVHVHDSYCVKNDEKSAHFHLIRTASVFSQQPKNQHILKKNQSTESSSYSYDIDIQMVDSICIIRPNTDTCHCIPMCYYEDMEIEWNPDYNNTNGVLIITEWNGVLMNGQTINSGTTIGIDIVEDNGVTILNNDLFDGMPDEAFVNLWLLRANIIDLSDVGEGTIEDLIALANEDPNLLETILEDDPEFLLALQDMTFACGAVAMLPFYLIRNL